MQDYQAPIFHFSEYEVETIKRLGYLYKTTTFDYKKALEIADNFYKNCQTNTEKLFGISLVSKIQEKLGQSLPIKQVFAHPTIAEQAALLSKSLAEKIKIDIKEENWKNLGI